MNQERAAPGRPGARISRKPVSEQVPVNEHQARHLVQLVRLLEGEALSHFGARTAARLPLDRYVEFFKLPGYRLFLEGAYASGFVCADMKPDNPLEAERGREAEAIPAWSFPQLRQYVHYLVRHERFAGGFSSPILQSLADGHLQRVADRLETDDSLYEAP